MSAATLEPDTEVPAAPAAGTIEVHDSFANAVRAVALAASTDESRAALTYLHVHVVDGTVTIDATDSYRIHRAVLHQQLATDLDVLLPAAWLVKTLREVKPPKGTSILEGDRTLIIGDGRVSMSCRGETRSIVIPATADGYPGVQSLLDAIAEKEPDEPVDELEVNPDYYADILKGCAMFAGRLRGARFQPTGTASAARFEVRDGDDRFYGAIMPLRMS